MTRNFAKKCTISTSMSIDAYVMRRSPKYVFYAELHPNIEVICNIWQILTKKTPFEPGKKATLLKMSLKSHTFYQNRARGGTPRPVSPPRTGLYIYENIKSGLRRCCCQLGVEGCSFLQAPVHPHGMIVYGSEI